MNDDYQLPEEKITECKEIFDLFDIDKDGAITTKVLADAIRALGANPTQSSIHDMISEIDQDGSGKIEFREFLHFYAKHMNDTDNEEDLIEVFKVFDMNGNGKISAQELKHVMTTLGDKLTEEEVDEVMMEADSNGDGYINYHEFVSIVMNR